MKIGEGYGFSSSNFMHCMTLMLYKENTVQKYKKFLDYQKNTIKTDYFDKLKNANMRVRPGTKKKSSGGYIFLTRLIFLGGLQFLKPQILGGYIA
jgi:hypothetical protein